MEAGGREVSVDGTAGTLLDRERYTVWDESGSQREGGMLEMEYFPPYAGLVGTDLNGKAEYHGMFRFALPRWAVLIRMNIQDYEVSHDGSLDF